MSEWKARRFWKQATVSQLEDEFGVDLDGRPVRTPSKALLRVPTAALATALTAEWDAQQSIIDPTTMPLTRFANSALDKVTPEQAAVVDLLIDYGDADATCYRAEAPEVLVRRQSKAWDPILDWVHTKFGARLVPVVGVVHQAQNPQALQRMAEPVRKMSPFQLAGFHDLVALSGSLVIGLAVTRCAWPDDVLWSWSRIDEDWQRDQWGNDDAATETSEAKRQAFLVACDFYRLSTIMS